MSRKIERAKIPERDWPHPGKFGDRFPLSAAKAGDWEELASYIEREGEVTPAMRKFLAAVLRGEAKRPKRRPRTAAIRKRHLEIAALVFELKQRGAKDFIGQASEFFGIDVKAVGRAANDFPHMDAETSSLVLAASPKFRRLPSRGIATHSGPPIVMHYEYPPRRKPRAKGQ